MRNGATFLAKQMKKTIFYYPQPTWGTKETIIFNCIVFESNLIIVSSENHLLVFLNSGFTEPRPYRYWKAEKRGIDFEGMIEDLEAAPAGAVVILHACAHNPTGCDPTREQWEKIAQVVKVFLIVNFIFNRLDIFSRSFNFRLKICLRSSTAHIKASRPEISKETAGRCAISISKDSNSSALNRSPKISAFMVNYHIFGDFSIIVSLFNKYTLSGERVGNLTVVLNNTELVGKVKSQFTINVRGMYSNPPTHGAKIVNTVLRDDGLFNEWFVKHSLISIRFYL